MAQMVLFDLDGTLFDTREDIADAVNEARQEFGLPRLSLNEVTEMVGFGVGVLAERAFTGSGVDPEVARATIMRHYTANPAGKARLYPGVVETLERIEAVRTIVSNKPHSLVEALIETHDLARFFKFVAGGDTFERRKPDPMAIHYLIEKFEVARSDVWVVGDHSPDIEMAKRAGVLSVYCNYGFFGDDRTGADFQIDRFSELLPLLNRRRN